MRHPDLGNFVKYEAGNGAGYRPKNRAAALRELNGRDTEAEDENSEKIRQRSGNNGAAAVAMKEPTAEM